MEKEINDIVERVLKNCNKKDWRPTEEESDIVDVLGDRFIEALSNPTILGIALDDLRIVRDERPDFSDHTAAAFVRLADEYEDFPELADSGWDNIMHMMQASDWLERLSRFKEPTRDLEDSRVG